MSEEITSPPYPRPTVTSAQLYRDLQALWDWTVDEQRSLRELITGPMADLLNDMPDALNIPPESPPTSVWEHVSVLDKYLVLVHMRMIREEWDAVIRDHEDSWDSRNALEKRLSLIHVSRYVLEDAFTDPETREARHEKARRVMLKRLRKERERWKQCEDEDDDYDDDDEVG